MRFANRCLVILLASASVLVYGVPDAVVETAAAGPQAAALPAAPGPAEPAPVLALLGEVVIPHEKFVLDNGLTVIVHEDRKAPVVAVSTWYNVGSKDEPNGKTGFAHLFEHLMFNGSENLPGDFFKYLQNVGATDFNGTTWFDRTNYFETVPRGALDMALFMESDRMGYLLGAVTQDALENQIGVVQNEKRQGDNRPGGLVDYEVLANLFPDGHPYRHDTIGSMADLDSASLADVKRWFMDKYGPNNAVLVLAGDISAAEARPLVEKYFGAIPRGAANTPASADVPTLTAARSIVMKDRVAAVQLQRHWAVPGLLSEQFAALDLGGSILGGLASSRLDRILVREEKLAVSVTAGIQPFHRIGMFEVTATVKPGIEPGVVDRRLDDIMSDYLAKGPTDDEVRRAATQRIAERIRGLEQVGGFRGKAVALAEGQVYAGDSDYYKKTLHAYASVTPVRIRDAMRQWLSRPAFSVRLEPGDRPPYEDAKGPKKASESDISTKSTARSRPQVGDTPPLDFPEVQHVSLSNGIRLAYARRATVPVTQLALSFDAGYASDTPANRGLQNLALGLLDEGADGVGSQQVAEEQERLGASISTIGTADRSNVTLVALTANLGPSLDLLADIVQRPDFNQGELDRVRSQTLTAIAQAQKEPNSIATRALPALLYGENHPYATTNLGEEPAVKAITRGDLVRFHQGWLRPDNLEIFVVSNLRLSELQPQIEARFGSWAPPAAPRGVKGFVAPPSRPTRPRVVLIDRPGSPQSVILAGQLIPVDPMGDVVPVTSANDVLGGNFLSRINMDLRETKGWSYGVRGSIALNVHAVPYVVTAPVQADRTGESIQALNEQIGAFLGPKGVTDEELARTTANLAQQLPGRFETSQAVLGAMMTNALYKRPDDYYESLAARYRALTSAGLDHAMRSAIAPNGFVWIVVGDAAKVRHQLAMLSMPVEVAQPR